MKRRINWGNNAPYYDEVPTILLENYVNRLYIGLIGKEPLDDEMERDVLYLRDNDVSFDSRQFNSQAAIQYYLLKETLHTRKHTFIEPMNVKSQLLEGVSNGVIQQEMGNAYQDAFLIRY